MVSTNSLKPCHVALFSAMFSVADGHAYIFYPPMRGGAFNNVHNGYTPQGLGSTNLPMPTCGNSKFLGWTDGPVTTIEAGTKLQIEIRTTAHHMGHYVFRLCDQVLGTGSGGYAGEEACLNRHILQRVRPEEIHDDCQPNDNRGDCQPYDEANPGHWYLPPSSAGFDSYKFHYWVPDGITCEKCTLQWWWMSANSGTPDPDAYKCYFQNMARLGWNANAWCSGACSYSGSCPASQSGPRNVGEQFKNCADVRIVDNGKNGGTVPTPAVTPTPGTSPTPAVTSPRRRRAFVANPRRRRAVSTVGSSCTGSPCPSTSQCRSQWGHCGTNADYCNSKSTWSAACNSPVTDAPEPEPESESEAEAEAEAEAEKEAEAESEAEAERGSEAEAESTTQTPQTVEAASCKAAPGLNNGVSDSECSKCAAGYKWWPCNTKSYCTCSSSCSWNNYWMCAGSLNQVQSKRRLRSKRQHSLSAGQALLQGAVDDTSRTDPNGYEFDEEELAEEEFAKDEL